MRGLPPMATLPLALALVAGIVAPVGARQERVPNNTRQCISLHAIRDQSAEGDDRLLFHMGGGKVYRNRLPAPCDNLRRINNVAKLKLHPKGADQLCTGDSVEVVSHDGSLLGVFGGGDTKQTNICMLGEFEPMTEMTLPEEMRR